MVFLYYCCDGMIFVSKVNSWDSFVEVYQIQIKKNYDLIVGLVVEEIVMYIILFKKEIYCLL